MKYWTNEDGMRLCEPDSCDEWLWMIWAIGVDYDGCNTVESLKDLVDEMVEMSQKARDCLYDGLLFDKERRKMRNVDWLRNEIDELAKIIKCPYDEYSDGPGVACIHPEEGVRCVDCKKEWLKKER